MRKELEFSINRLVESQKRHRAKYKQEHKLRINAYMRVYMRNRRAGLPTRKTETKKFKNDGACCKICGLLGPVFCFKCIEEGAIF